MPKVVKTYDCLRRVIKHFEISTKSKEKLNEALAILEMNQFKLGYKKYKLFDVTKFILVLPTFQLKQQSLSRTRCCDILF